MNAPLSPRLHTALFLFAGIGAGALGFLDAQVTLRGNTARFRSLGGVDFDPIACRSFERLTKSPAACADLWAGYAAVADERRPSAGPIPVRWAITDLDKAPPVVPVIPGRGDGSWHRPLTLLERAALQGLPATLDGKPLDLEGTLAKISEHIGNAVPVQAAAAIAGEMLRTLILAAAGAFMLSSGSGVWVRKNRDGSFPLYLEQELRRASKRARRQIRVRLAEDQPTVQVSSIEGSLQ